MADNLIKISDAHARVLERASNIKNGTAKNQLFNDNNDNDDNCIYLQPYLKDKIYTNPNNFIVEKNKKLPVQYHKQIFQANDLPNYKSVDSFMYVKCNTSDTLRINLVSPVFDPKFNSKPVNSVKMIKNNDGSVDFIVYFGNKCDKIITQPHYPKNPVYVNSVKPVDLCNPCNQNKC